METKFNSQICTTREQSERLLALGLKKETADMSWVLTDEDREGNAYSVEYLSVGRYQSMHPDWYTPAWSLGRLIKLMPRTAIIHTEEGDARIDIDMYAIEILVSDDPIAEAVSVIEWLIKEGNFNKEYLV